jgi:acetyl esterase/lipase
MIDLTWQESLPLGLSRNLTWLLRAFAALSRAPAVGRIERDVIYARHAGVNLGLDVLVPPGEGPWPVVMMIHGGGFIMGDKAQLEYTCRTLANAGFLVFNVNYRLAPEYPRPAQVDDCTAALQWVKDNAAGYGGDPTRLCVGGGSAGAYLAAALGVLSHGGPQRLPAEASGEQGRSIDAGFQAALLLNGVFDLEATRSSDFPRVEFMLRCFLGDSHADLEELRAASPIHHLSGSFPPAFIAVGTQDPLHGESVAMTEALSSRGISVESREYANSTHGWFNWFWTENARRAHEHMVAWLHGQLG